MFILSCGNKNIFKINLFSPALHYIWTKKDCFGKKLVKCPNFDLSGDNLIEMLTQPKVRDETDGKKKDDKDDDDDDEDDDKDDKDDKKESKLIYFLTCSIVDNSPCREEG